MKRRQEIYEALGLVSKHGGDHTSLEYKDKKQARTMPTCFSDDTAQKIGLYAPVRLGLAGALSFLPGVKAVPGAVCIPHLALAAPQRHGCLALQPR